MIGALSDPILQGDFQTVAYRPIAYRGFTEKALRRKNVPAAGLLAYPVAAALPGLKDAWLLNSFPQAPASVVIEEADRFDRRFDAFWEELMHRIPTSCSESGELGDHPGTFLDRCTGAPVDSHRLAQRVADCLLHLETPRRDNWCRTHAIDRLPIARTARRSAARVAAAGTGTYIDEDYHVLEHLGCGLPKIAVFQRFAPTAGSFLAGRFYYREADPALASQLTRPEAWDPSTYDGDASYD